MIERVLSVTLEVDDPVAFAPVTRISFDSKFSKFDSQQRQRSIQRNAQRGGLRSKYRSGQQVIWGNQSYAQPYRRRRYRTPRLEGTVKVPEDRTQGRTPDRGRDIETLGELMICKRCRGPLRWYLEDEIAAARDIMMKRKQEIYKAEMEKNIKIAKQKENRRRRRRKKKLSKFYEDTFKGDIFI
ncbi:uncharacterized protein LOC117159088 [Bombus vancouverensis nearcticus]|uniref:uncharacterized protein LOC117159088 n=1 Tax=Bombus vancouverensis nearcticus TaxID=2705178 RepID=UPI00402B9766